MTFPSDHDETAVVDTVTRAIMMAGQSEALMSVMGNIGMALETINRMAEHDSELIPELRATVDALGVASDAAAQTMVFINTRFEVTRERLFESGGDDAEA